MHYHHFHFLFRVFPILWHGWLLVMIIGQIASWWLDGIAPWLKHRAQQVRGFRIEDEYPPRYPG